MKKSIIFLLYIFIHIHSHAQRQAENWVFGTAGMISFLTAEPVYNQTVNRLTYGGAACMSDENGQLLFSSDGNTVYDQLYRDMPNGQFPTLDGNRYANGSQSVITVPFSGHPLQYYRHKVQE